MADVQLILKSNSNLLTLDQLKDVANDNFLNAATVTVTLKDLDGNSISGESWPLAMSYVSGSDGKYIATVAAAISVVEGDEVEAHVSAVESGLTYSAEVPCRVVTRRS